MLVPIRFETIACDLPEGGRRIITGEADLGCEPKSETMARMDFFGEFAELARTSPTFQRDLMAFLLRSLKPRTAD
jgi:hypothetical protein